MSTTDTNKATVDLVAVLERARDDLKARGQAYIAEQAAIAAVAKLIEAAKRANGDHSAPHDCYATGPLTGDPIRDLVSCPGCELAAALANIQGGAA